MDKEKELPKRKSTRLKNYDYSSTGVYFVTICIRDRKQVLSEIVKTIRPVTGGTGSFAVGEGLAPPEYSVRLNRVERLRESNYNKLSTDFQTLV